MKSAIFDPRPPRNAVLPWASLMMLLCATILVSGCKSFGPLGSQSFDPTYSRTLEANELLLYSAPANIMVGTYMEGEEELYPVNKGVLLLTSERILFAPWNEKQQRYEPVIWTAYPLIGQVKKHNNILLQYIAIVATDGSKFTYFLGSKTVDPAYAILMEQIEKYHKIPLPVGSGI